MPVHQVVTIVVGVVTLVAMFTGVVVYAIRIEGRLNVMALRIQHLEDIAKTHAEAAAKISGLSTEVEYMKAGIDDIKKMVIQLIPPLTRSTRRRGTGEG